MNGKPKAPHSKQSRCRIPSPPAFSGFGSKHPTESPEDPIESPEDPIETAILAELRRSKARSKHVTPERERLSPANQTSLYKHFLPAAVFARATESMSLKGPGAECGAYLLEVVDEMKPRDALERMLIQQTVLAHARVIRLTDLATAETTHDGIRVMNELADRASNTFRRQVLALAEYRRPSAVLVPTNSSAANTTINSFEQINIAGQQLIQTHVHAKPENATNEQGCSESAASQAQFAPNVDAAARSSAARASQPDSGQSQIPAAALPADTGRA